MVSSGGTVQRINDYIGRSWYGDKKYFAENEEIKELFSEYYADYVEELTTGLISNRPTPLLSYMRADASNFDVANN